MRRIDRISLSLIVFTKDYITCSKYRQNEETSKYTFTICMGQGKFDHVGVDCGLVADFPFHIHSSSCNTINCVFFL